VGQQSSLVLLLPHAHEGQGPDPRQRPSRALPAAAADLNVRIANCTTAAQYFHLLRRRPRCCSRSAAAVVLTPKSLLRTRSWPRRLASWREGAFHACCDDQARDRSAPTIRRIIPVHGKVYVDSPAATNARHARDTRHLRVEQLYPAPVQSLRADVRELRRTRRGVSDAGRAREHGRVGLSSGRTSPRPRGGRRARRSRGRAARVRRKDRRHAHACQQQLLIERRSPSRRTCERAAQIGYRAAP
jgi:2-oxoglutarate dehydrogenase complex dehydrogenase (E1) component-like enzyme